MQSTYKRVSKELKFNILKDHFENGTPISQLARINGIHPITIYQWKRAMGEKPEEKIDMEKVLEELNQLRKDKKQLTEALGELTLDNQCLRDLNEFLKKRQQAQLLKKPGNSSKKKKVPTRK